MQAPHILIRQPLSTSEYGDPDMGVAAEELAEKYGLPANSKTRLRFKVN